MPNDLGISALALHSKQLARWAGNFTYAQIPLYRFLLFVKSLLDETVLTALVLESTRRILIAGHLLYCKALAGGMVAKDTRYKPNWST